MPRSTQETFLAVQCSHTALQDAALPHRGRQMADHRGHFQVQKQQKVPGRLDDGSETFSGTVSDLRLDG